MRRGLILVGAAAVLAAVVATVLAPAGAHPPGEQPKRVWVGSAGLWTKGALGAYCWMHDGTGVCADRVRPREVDGHLPVRPRGRVDLVVRDHAESVRVSLTRAGGGEAGPSGWSARARRPTGDPHRWRFRLPARLDDATRIEVFARYSRGGDASFSAGIDPRPGRRGSGG